MQAQMQAQSMAVVLQNKNSCESHEPRIGNRNSDRRIRTLALLSEAAAAILVLTQSTTAYAAAAEAVHQDTEFGAAAINIPPGTLAEALNTLAKQTGADLVYRPEQVAGLMTSGVHGELSIADAISRLLKGTELQLSTNAAGAFLIAAPKSTASSSRSSNDAEAARSDSLSTAGKRAEGEGLVRLAQENSFSARAGSETEGDRLSDRKNEPQDVKLEEIIVTAQKRVERQQDVPVSAQIVSGAQLANSNINSLADLSQTVPSISLGENTGRTNEMFIRGIGSGANQSFDQSVGTFVDDIYHGRARTSTGTFFDLERVEILKGPQSTFFGNSAIAGALNVVSRKPGDAGSWVRALYGEAGRYAVEGAVGGSISDAWAWRAAATFNGTEGWIENVTTDDKQPSADNRAGRVYLRYAPHENLETLLKVEMSRNRDHSGFYLQLDPTTLDEDQNAENGGQRADLDTKDVVFTVNYENWGHAFTSVSGYYEYDYVLDLDADVTPLTLFAVHAPEDYSQYSQEFRIASPADRTFEYLGGLYFQYADLSFAQDFNYHFLSPFLVGSPFEPFLPLAEQTAYQQIEKTYSAFVSGTWNITEQLRFSVGARASRVQKKMNWLHAWGTGTQTYGGFTPMPAVLQQAATAISGSFGVPGTIRLSRSDDGFTPSANIQYRITPQIMTYVSYADGFKAGGFNGTEPARFSVDAGNFPFGAEKVDAYEAGLKSEWFDSRLLFNLAAFQSDYRGLQVSANTMNAGGNFVSVIRNVGKSRSRGVEFETRWAATRNLRLSVIGTYLEAENFDVQPDGVVTSSTAAHAPRWSGAVTGEYGIPLPNDYELSTEVSLFHSDATRVDALTAERFNAYDRIDARIALQAPGAKWAVDLIGKNLSDERIYTSYGFATVLPGGTVLPGTTQHQLQQPRNFAVQFRYNW